MPIDAALFGFGLIIGAIGTLVGVGGGFLIVPVIALIEPRWEARTITASLAVVSANTCSGTTAYMRQRRVDLRSVGAYIVAALPDVVLGVSGADRLSRGWFDPLFGLLLACMAALLAIAPDWRPPAAAALSNANSSTHAAYEPKLRGSV